MADQPPSFRGNSTQPLASSESDQTTHRKFDLFKSLPAELRIEVWKEAIESASRTNHRMLDFEEEARVFLEEDSSSEDANEDSCEAVRFLLKPGKNLAKTTRSIRSLARVCYEARYEVLKRRVMMAIEGVQVPFDPDRNIVCIRPRSNQQLWPIYTTKDQFNTVLGPDPEQDAGHAGLLRNAQPLPRSVQHLAIDCRTSVKELVSQGLFDLIGLLIFGSEASSLSLVHRACPRDHSPKSHDELAFITFLRKTSFCNADRVELKYLLFTLRVIAGQGINTAEDWTEAWNVSGDFLRRRWHRLREMRVQIRGYPPAGFSERRR